ncbi:MULTISPECIES: ABC transporter ATP-binding protein [unclassified Fredinandcohnia]|uniref:ABC transporter ATP-binding protein n=1 Tax=unclassified Fredinandcohnia TaxID=2837514 RepID=UPI0030FD8704
MLNVENLQAFYGNAQALEDINFTLNEGEIVCLIGNNGAGKSTTLMSISGIVKQKKGTIIFNGEDITRLPPHQIVSRGIIQVPEGRRIFTTLTVEENLKLGGFLKRKVTKSRIEEIYSIFPRLKERRNQLGGSLSGGEQQMLAIGRAMIGEPKLLMLDEPSLGLAPQIIDMIFDSIIALRKAGTTILLIEQNAELALDVSDRAYVIELGRCVLSGECEALRNDQKIQSIYLG